MEKRQRIEEALKEIGIHSIKDLNEAIKKEKPLDLGIMTGDAEAVRKAGEKKILTLGETLRAAEGFTYIRIKVKKCGLMFETRYKAEELKGHQNEEFEKLKEKEVIRFCNNRMGIDEKDELEIEIKEGK
mgnify:CR=1 FL=1